MGHRTCSRQVIKNKPYIIYYRSIIILLIWINEYIFYKIRDGIGKEIITRYSTDLKNNGQFYTDANGRQNILRTRNKRKTYKLRGNDPVASNYYPVTSHAFLTDSKTGYRMNVLTDRAQGGSSIEDGQLEFLIHRRLVQQDICRFKEPLDETAYGKGLVVRGTHTLFFQDTKNNDSYKPGSLTSRSLVLERSREPVISFISTKYTFDQWLKFFASKVYYLCVLVLGPSYRHFIFSNSCNSFLDHSQKTLNCWLLSLGLGTKENTSWDWNIFMMLKSIMFFPAQLKSHLRLVVDNCVN